MTASLHLRYNEEMILRIFLAPVFLMLFLDYSAFAQKQVPNSQAEVKLSFAPLVKKVAPAVVNIFTTKTVTQRSFSPLFDEIGRASCRERV